ncbi:MAG: N-acetylmuramoyl-L-alanine amidase [Lysobacteraceae bacterium]|nr:MAG: N-acetylmuramoyl-L-alanine amidase [Xanthomonadaceae bacterium]
MQGSYAGSIAWFQNNPYSVSAHYLIRSSDGQVTQMVREAQAAHHVGSQNAYTLGIEHEGYVDDAAWYTTAMYNASAALTRHFCTRHAIPCASAYNGPAHGGVNVLPASVRIKGHQHYTGQTHTDPGIHWDWRRYYALLNPGSGGNPVTLDGFEGGEGHFNTAPAYSGSTTGIAATSTADRDCTIARIGSCSEHLRLIDNAANTQAWSVRFLSGSGTPSANMSVARNGRLGFWVYVAGSGFSVGIGVDDSDGTERSTQRAVAANTWTWVEWNLTDAAAWNAWVGGSGAITAASVTVDAIWLERAHTTYTVNAYLDEVRWTPN